MGEAFDSLVAGIPLINLDHHITNSRFGTVNWIEPAAVATAQLVLALGDALAWELSLPVATCLLTGIVTDTRGFRTVNVGVHAMRAALRLVEAGASPGGIAWRSLDQRPLDSVRLWGEAIGHLRLESGILWTEVPLAMVRHWSPAEDGTTGLTNFLAGVREARVVAVFAERSNGKVDVGLRAVPGYDVAQVALELGGGGHPQASGCTLKGSLDAVREQVLIELRRNLAEQSRNDE
jgi:phosphoesterase RecJ-like protein